MTYRSGPVHLLQPIDLSAFHFSSASFRVISWACETGGCACDTAAPRVRTFGRLLATDVDYAEEADRVRGGGLLVRHEGGDSLRP